MKKIVSILLWCAMLSGVAYSQSFQQKWPIINEYMQKSVTNIESGGVVTNMPTGGFIQKVSSNNWIVYFPVAGVITNTLRYTDPLKYLNVVGGLLTMSGSPSGNVNVIELLPSSIESAGFVKTSGTPCVTWTLSQNSDPMKIRREATGISIKNGDDNAFADLTCNNLYVLGTNTIFTGQSLNLTTNIIVLNADKSGPPVAGEQSWIKIERGTSQDSFIQWDESSTRWYFNDGNHSWSFQEIESYVDDAISFHSNRIDVATNDINYIYGVTFDAWNIAAWSSNNVLSLYDDYNILNQRDWPAIVEIQNYTSIWNQAYNIAIGLTNGLGDMGQSFNWGAAHVDGILDFKSTNPKDVTGVENLLSIVGDKTGSTMVIESSYIRMDTEKLSVDHVLDFETAGPIATNAIIDVMNSVVGYPASPMWGLNETMQLTPLQYVLSTNSGLWMVNDSGDLKVSHLEGYDVFWMVDTNGYITPR